MNISNSAVSFNEIERIVHLMCNALGCQKLREILEEWDDALADARDKKKYRDKGKRKTTIKTVVGEVEYRRRVYEVRDEAGDAQFVYLLDEAMGQSGSGVFSELLIEKIVQSCCDGTYRNAAQAVSELTGQTISHTAAWCVTQAVGEQVDKREREAAALAAKDEGRGTIEAPVLFEEQDGIYIKLQGKDRKEHGSSKEMKVAIAYDGARNVTKKAGGKPRYELTNKVACAGFENAGQFAKRKEGVIAEAYNVDEIEMRILGGDGAGWVRKSQAADVHFQLDVFHRNSAVLEYVSDPEARKTIMEVLYSKDIDLLLHTIETYMLSTDDGEEREKYGKLLSYYTNNKDGLASYKQRGLKIPEAPEGKEYRRMGTMESNIFTIIGNRMKGGRACWSINGGNNLAKLLCLRHTGKLPATLKGLSTCILPEKYVEEITVETSAAQVPEREGKGYDGYHKFSVPASMPWMKEIAAIKSLC